MNRKILIADDDSDLSMIICDTLYGCGYEADWAEDTTAAYYMLAKKKYDLLLLDVNMPGENGLEFCRKIREMSSVPIIFISARDGEEDRIAGLDIGGDDYMGKPFSLKELVSRVHSLIRRTYGINGDREIITIGDIEIHPVTRCVRKKGNVVKLSPKEMEVLLYLAKNKNCTIKKETLLNEAWGMFRECEMSTLSVHIRWLREKLEDDPAEPKYIKTVWGTGYILCDGEEE